MKLKTILKIKIGCTLCFWSLPLLFFNSKVARLLGFPDPQPRIWIHLLGAAYLALLVCYEIGRREHERGKDVRYVIAVGVVSNGLASLILWSFGLAQAWLEWGTAAKIYMWASALLTLLITLGLLASRKQAVALESEGRILD
ncbi:MAG TPA: hypothetical protein VF527_13290 [Pyrinomonadaceae bacterium]|jgi:hypothetical protein